MHGCPLAGPVVPATSKGPLAALTATVRAAAAPPWVRAQQPLAVEDPANVR